MPKSVSEQTARDIEIGAIMTEPGSATQYLTSGWRTQRPSYNFKRCIKCGICQIYCPEGCIEQTRPGYFRANFNYCKGCGICARECPTRVITMVEEE